MTLCEMYHAYSDTHRIIIKPKDFSDYIQITESFKTEIEAKFKDKKHNHTIYLLYALNLKYPYLSPESMGVLIEKTKQNVMYLNAKLNVWKRTYDDFKQDLETVKTICNV